MKKVFVINHSVRFDPRSRTLSSLQRPENTVQLHTPACECLVLLLTHNGETVSHSYLSEEVWIKKGHYVTTNSLYQNIAAIRRGLKTVGLDDEILKTIPKSGFQIYAFIEEEERPPVIKEPSNTTFSEEKEEVSQKKPEVLLTDKKTNYSPSTISIKLLYSVLAVIFVSGVFLLYKENASNKNFFSSYTHVGLVNKCDVYSSYIGKEKSTVFFSSLMRDSLLTCPPGGKAWLTFNANYRVSSIVLCDQDIDKISTNCKSYVYSGDVNEKL